MADDSPPTPSLPAIPAYLSAYAKEKYYEEEKYDDAEEEQYESDVKSENDAHEEEDEATDQDDNEESSEDDMNIDEVAMVKDHNEATDQEETAVVDTPTPTKKLAGRRPGSRTKRTNTQPIIDDPGKELSMFPSSARYLKNSRNKKRKKDPHLASAYSALNTARQEREIVSKFMEETEEEVKKLKAKLKVAEENLEKSKVRLQHEEEAIKRALDAVGEAELKMPCPWNTQFQKLVAYKEKHGHINLPNRCPEDREFHSLCIWVCAQKRKYITYRYGESRTWQPWKITALEKLGIEWEPRNGRWKEQYDELVAYKEQHGHCNVPTRTSKEHKDLGTFVAVQRMEYSKFKRGKMSNLSAERIDLLEKIGFVWNVTDLKWQEMYNKLVKFQADEEHCNVPGRYPPDQSLSNWVARQRKEYLMYKDKDVDSEKDSLGRTRQARMTQEKFELLDKLGFEWE